ncbi:MAG TPA: terminase gpA endonuclease subunit [Bryobacteraceae bacterium]
MLSPPERLPLDQWAEKHFYLSSEYAPRTGPIRLYNFQREVFNAFTDENTQEIVLMSSTQMVKTLTMQAALAYIIACVPGPVLMLFEKDRDGAEFSTKRLAPMLRDSPILTGKVLETSHGPGAKKATNTILSKTFPNGSLSLTGTQVGGNLASKTIQYLLMDEIDRYAADVDREGDPIELAMNRVMQFKPRHKVIMACSPTLEHSSKILRQYNQTDMRQYWVPCHTCGESQVLDFWTGVKFDKFDQHGVKLTNLERAKSARYECIHCHARWTDLQRINACEKGVWKARRPFAGKAGFHISHLYSPKKSIQEIVAHYLRVRKDRTKHKTFINTVLAEPWIELGVTPDEELLYKRRESYPFGENAVVPQRGLFLTAAVDVQESPPRLEVEVRAWGRDRESWSVDYQIIQAFSTDAHRTPLPVNSPEVWAELDRRVLQREYRHESGNTLSIWAIGIDTGMNPQPVYNFALTHPQPAYNIAGGVSIHSQKTVVPVKGGNDENKIIHSVTNESAARRKQGVRIVHVGTQCIKAELFDNLRYSKSASEPTPNRIHFPRYDMQYFLGLCSERRVITEKGLAVWQKRFERNEPLDLAVYNRAMYALCADRFKEHHWKALEEALAPRCVVEQEPEIPRPLQVIRAPRKVAPAWMNR